MAEGVRARSKMKIERIERTEKLVLVIEDGGSAGELVPEDELIV
jgi:hypothetical protein